MNQIDRDFPRFYFALPRLLATLRGGDGSRAEKNAGEAWAGSIATFVVSYLFFAGFVPNSFAWWITGLLFGALAVLVLLFWLLALYLNSMVLRLVRIAGLFNTTPARRGQSVLIATTTTLMALALLRHGGLAREIAAIWLVAVAMNLVAAMILAFRHGARARS